MQGENSMLSSVSALALVSALFYCVAMFAMKFWTEVPSLGLAVVIGAALLTAGAFEVFALRHERLGLIYVGILAAEIIIIAAVSLLHFNESYSFREWLGISIVVIGAAIAWS